MLWTAAARGKDAGGLARARTLVEERGRSGRHRAAGERASRGARARARVAALPHGVRDLLDALIGQLAHRMV